MSEQEYAHFAQIQAILWLQQRCEDQFVRAWLVNERKLLQDIKYPVTATGTELEKK